MAFSSKGKLSNPFVLPLAIIIIGGAIGGYAAFNQKPVAAPTGDPSQPTPSAPTVATEVTIDDDEIMGSKDAPVTIIEFSDYQCPFCKRFRDTTLDALKTQFIDTGKVRFVYRDFPLSGHTYAQKASEATECAREQGKFWEMHDAIFAHQDAITVPDLKKYAAELGIDTGKFDTCLDSGKFEAEVKKDLADGLSAGVDATPTFYINGEQLQGAQPTASFEAAINKALGN